MNNEPNSSGKQNNFSWVIDENKCLSFEEVKKLKRAARKARAYGLQKNKFTQIRVWFMVELGLNAGLRVGEMVALKHSNLLTDRGRSSIIATGKREKKRAVWISSGFKRICQEYNNYKKRFGYSTDDEAHLLTNLKGTKITKRALQKFFKNIIKKSGLSPHYHIHCLRHTYTTFLLKSSNYNYRFVQRQLGHSSIRTTQIYAGVLESEGKKAIEKLYK